jgi:hypothetical protein
MEGCRRCVAKGLLVSWSELYRPFTSGHTVYNSAYGISSKPKEIKILVESKFFGKYIQRPLISSFLFSCLPGLVKNPIDPKFHDAPFCSLLGYKHQCSSSRTGSCHEFDFFLFAADQNITNLPSVYGVL